MKSQEIIAYAAGKKVLLSRDAAEFLESRTDAQSLVDSVSITRPGFAGKEVFEQLLSNPNSLEKPVVVLETRFKPLAKDVEARVKPQDPFALNGKRASKGELDDFLSYFKSNFSKRRDILLKRDINCVEVSKLKNFPPRSEVNVIGMVYEKYETKNGHVMMDLEDFTGRCKVLVLKDDQQMMQQAQDIVSDDVVLVNGSKGGGNPNPRFQNSDPMIVAKGLMLPEIPMHSPPSTKEDVCVAITSDLHVGHKKFEEAGFQKFLNWLNGKTGSEKQLELAGKVKYLTIAGDLVDGVGVYPSQEEEQTIIDIFKQYEAFESFMEQVPDYVQVIAIPGNHDAARVEEPVPRLNEKYVPKTSRMKNFYHLSSPGKVELHGFKFLLYHGNSMFNVFSMLPHKCTTQHPEKAMVEYLRRRHLSPFYGETPNSRTLIFPERDDMLVIDEVPDVFITGHLHRNGYENYRGTLVVNPGAWQGWTPYQAKQGIMPTPGIVPVLSLKNFTIHEMKFLTQ